MLLAFQDVCLHIAADQCLLQTLRVSSGLLGQPLVCVPEVAYLFHPCHDKLVNVCMMNLSQHGEFMFGWYRPDLHEGGGSLQFASEAFIWNTLFHLEVGCTHSSPSITLLFTLAWNTTGAFHFTANEPCSKNAVIGYGSAKNVHPTFAAQTRRK